MMPGADCDPRGVSPDRVTGSRQPAGSPVVIDTNRVLDLWLFEDPDVATLGRDIRAGAVRWIALPAMRDELARVLAYPALARPLAQRGRMAADVLTAFDRWTLPVADAAVASVRCRDPDDQMYVDLAVAWRATLYSRDRQVLELAARLSPLGVSVRS